MGMERQRKGRKVDDRRDNRERTDGMDEDG